MKTSLSLVLLLSSFLSAQVTLPTATEQVSTTARATELLVTAVGSDGKPVANLTKEEIGVLVDNDQHASISAIHRISTEPLHLGIVFFASRSFFPKEQAAAIALVQKLIQTNSDTAFVLTAGGSRPLVETQITWQSDRDALTKTIQSLEWDRGIADAFNFKINDREEEHEAFSYLGLSSGGQREWNMAQQRAQGTTIFDAVWEMMKSGPQGGRHVLVIFREPWAHATGGDSQSFDYVQSQLVKIIATAQRLRIPIYSIGIEDPVLVPSESKTLGAASRWSSFEEQIQRERQKLYFTGKANISRMSAETGGQTYWSSTKNYSDVVDNIVRELQGQYSLTFVPPSAGPVTSAHPIKYVPSRPNLHLNGPSAYYLDPPPGN